MNKELKQNLPIFNEVKMYCEANNLELVERSLWLDAKQALEDKSEKLIDCDLISRKAVLNITCDNCKYNDKCLQAQNGLKYPNCAYSIKQLPSVTQQMGKWKITPMSQIVYCSKCDKLVKNIPASIVCSFKFCPSCGCKMKLDK